jgi:DNA-binding NarL/FixJ family response regulator
MRDIVNPWGLTARQTQVMDAYIVGGCLKRAAHNLDLSLTSVSDHVTNSKKKMGMATPFHALLQWDRYRRGDKDSKYGVMV